MTEVGGRLQSVKSKDKQNTLRTHIKVQKKTVNHLRKWTSKHIRLSSKPCDCSYRNMEQLGSKGLLGKKGVMKVKASQSLNCHYSCDLI